MRSEPNANLVVAARPGARKNEVVQTADGFRISTTAPPEDGKANAAIRALLADHLGVPKTRLVLVRGESARQKVFRLD